MSKFSDDQIKKIMTEIDAESKQVLRDHEDRVVLMPEAAALLEKDKNQFDYFSVGFESFDKIMQGGLAGGDLVVISGRTGMGKTTLAQTFSANFDKQGIPQLWFSYEVEIDYLWQKFMNMGMSNDSVVYCPLKPTSGNLEWVERKITEASKKFHVQSVFIDHLGFLSPKQSEKDVKIEGMGLNYSIYLTGMVRQLKKLALDHRLVIFLLAHVRKTRELDIDDIAHSAGIAQEADFVFLVDRVKKLSAQKSKLDKAADAGGWEEDLYTDESNIMLVKNRRTGVNKLVKCQFLNNKLVPLSQINIEEIGID